MKRFFLYILLGIFSFWQLSAVSFAEDTTGTVLPETDKAVWECEIILNYFTADIEIGSEEGLRYPRDFLAKRQPINIPALGTDVTENQVLGCGIKTGNITLWMVPFYIRYILQFILSIAGLVAIGAIIYGGYFYMFAGVSDDKDKGKKAIFNGIIGFVITMVAWTIVNIVIALVT